MLVERSTRVPCEVALRWATLDRHDYVATSTLMDDLRAISRLYEWADCSLEVPLDEYIVTGSGFTARQISSLALYVRRAEAQGQSHAASPHTTAAPSTPAAFNGRWRKIGAFLRWSAETYARDVAGRRGNYQARIEARDRIERLMHQHLMRETMTSPVRALSGDEWERVQQVIDLDREDIWPDPKVRFRNHVMVYLAMNTGLRIGEMLKLNLGQVPRSSEECLVVKRNPEDPNDPRLYPPEVKTNEREIFVPPLIRSLLGAYVSRYRPRSQSPYLFLAQGGRPLSSRAARRIVERIGLVARIQLNWHRFRHTFLDLLYESLADRDNGTDLLKEVAGWNAASSADPYVRRARQKKAYECLVRYQASVYMTPGAFENEVDKERVSS